MEKAIEDMTRNDWRELRKIHQKMLKDARREDLSAQSTSNYGTSIHTEKTMEATVSKSIEKVPAPKFNMFDEVYFEGERLTIVGMRLITPVYALLFDWEHWGWHYYVSPIFGASPEEVVGINPAVAEGVIDVPESDLCPASRSSND